jgi:predicted RNA-binding protein with PIN domain
MPYWFDGNNLIGQSALAAVADSQPRRAFLSALSNYHRSGGGRFLVYFDGSDPNRSAAPPGVEVRYSAPESTDGAIVRRLQEIPHPSQIIVVTNDRNLLTRCRNAGASTLNWHQFASKMQSRFAQSHASHSNPDQQVDVEDWMRYFGFDKKDM